MRKVFVLLTLLVFGTGVYLSTAVAGVKVASSFDRCRDFFTVCTEGGCVKALVAQSCVLICDFGDAEGLLNCTADETFTEFQP